MANIADYLSQLQTLTQRNLEILRLNIFKYRKKLKNPEIFKKNV